MRPDLLDARDKWRTDRTPDPADVSANGAMAFALKWAGAKSEAMDHAARTEGRIESVPWGYVGGLTGFAEALSKRMD